MSGPEPEPDGPVSEYAGGEIQVRHRPVNRWLLVVYVLLAAWGAWYLVTHWGGLGPGLAIP